MGSKQTNRADKPEWYFTQILTWIRDHQDFVEQNVQPVYNKLNIKKTSARVKCYTYYQLDIKKSFFIIILLQIIFQIEFIRGLVHIAVEKLHFELPQLSYNDSLFAHCMDEALGFDKEVRNGYGYPTSEPGVIEIITQAQIFLKWINMEKRCKYNNEIIVILKSEKKNYYN